MTNYNVDLPPRPCTTAAAALPYPMCHTGAPPPEAAGTALRVERTPPNSFLDHALDLAQLGIRVHPLEPQHAEEPKKPCLKGYKRHASTDEATIRAWWHRWPNANVGLIAGAGSYVFMLDVDHRNNGDRSLRILEAQHPELPLTWQYSTSDGPRILFRYPSTGRVTTGDIMPGITILGDARHSDGWNVVGPGSIHENGARYEWDDFHSPATIPLADPPLWLLDLMQAKGRYTCRTAAPALPWEASKGTSRSLLASSALDHAAKGVSGSLDGAAVKALFGQGWVVQRCLTVLGLEHVQVGEKFTCILHPEAHPSAAIMPPLTPTDSYVYADFHHREDEPYMVPLPLLYFCQITKASTATRLPEPSFLVWSLRLLAEAGVIDGVPIQAPKLKGHVPQDAQRVYAGFLQLLSLKWLVTANAPSPLSWRFAQEWLGGMAQTAVARAIGWLLGHGYLREIDKLGKLSLFLFGTRALINRRRKRSQDPKTAHTDIIKDVAQDLTAMLTPDEKACTDCGRGGFIDTMGRCHWCIAMETQRRIDEKKALYQPPAFASG